MRWLLPSGSYFHRGEDGTRSVIEHVETILTLPVFSGARGRSSCIRSSKILLHAEVVATEKGERKENEGSKGKRERERERGLTRSGTRRGMREASGKKPSAIAIRTNIRSRDERRTNKEKCEREREKAREECERKEKKGMKGGWRIRWKGNRKKRVRDRKGERFW